LLSYKDKQLKKQEKIKVYIQTRKFDRNAHIKALISFYKNISLKHDKSQKFFHFIKNPFKIYTSTLKHFKNKYVVVLTRKKHTKTGLSKSILFGI
jgi:hypothetical protein